MSEIAIPGAPNTIPAGYRTQSLAGGLPSIVLASDVANADILELTGTLTVQNINVVIPAPLFPQQVVGVNSYAGPTHSGWLKLIRNSTTGAFNVTVSGPNGTSAGVPQAAVGWYYSPDGVNVFAVTAPTLAGSSVIYRPGGAAAGNIFADPWQLALNVLLSGVPTTVYVDCSLVSPAPWPVDFFLPNVTFAQSPVVANPAVLGLVAGTNPVSNTPSNGALLFIAGLDAVGVVNVSSVPPYTMVQAGEIFGRTFTMSNGAYIQRANDAAPLALGILTNGGSFNLRIQNCQDPFPNLADPTAANVQFGFNGATLNVLVTDAGPSLHLPSFNGAAGLTLNLNYDDTVPSSQLGQASWAGTVNLVPYSEAASMSYAPSNLANWSGVAPTSVANALDRLAAKSAPIP